MLSGYNPPIVPKPGPPPPPQQKHDDPIELLPWQQTILDEILREPRRHVIVSVPRQAGRHALQRLIDDLVKAGVIR